MARDDFAGAFVADFVNGCLGVDLNAEHVVLTLLNAIATDPGLGGQSARLTQST
ncbi:hypothetical protein [Bradyrhizobium sp. NAS96.2]|uniref:hypothetical protein n=1 Tax=Bradyrhizobium sp. NAS96.2 TaxID=1680160 RepID=UPI00143D73E1|nr:hypothetical protein [Bradyrhizobium sp. NAS96.2]